MLGIDRRWKVVLVDAMLEPHVVVKAPHLLKDLVAEGALEESAHLHVQCAYVAARVVAIGEALTALATPHRPVRLHQQLGSDGV